MYITTLVENTGRGNALGAEHGLSLYIETGGYKILFDMGQSALFAVNAARLGIDLSKVDFAVLSHGHYDHGGGLGHFMRINQIAPVYVSRYAFEPHYNAAGKDIGVSLEGLDTSRIRFVDDDLEIGPGIWICSCNDRQPLVQADTFGQTRQEKGHVMPEDYRHEQYLVIREHGRRYCVSGCSHKGIINIVRWLAPDVVIGGFHYMKVPMTQEGKTFLRDAAAALIRTGTEYYTGHCTGDDQYELLKSVMGGKLKRISCGFSEEIL